MLFRSMAALAATADDKLTGFAVRFALVAHRGIPRQDEPDFLAEADAAFTPAPKSEKKPKQPKVTKPTLVLAKKKKGAAKKAAA